MLGLLPAPLRRRALRAAFDRAREAFDRGDIDAVTALFAADVEYVPPPPLGADTLHGRAAVIGFWREVFARYERNTIENLSIEEAQRGRFVRLARLRHGSADAVALEYTIRQTTVLRAGRVVLQVNELQP